MAGRLRPAQARLICFFLVLGAASAAYRLVYATDLERTAALYVGVPTILGIGLALMPRGINATEMAVRGSLIALVVAGVILPEGFICLLFAAPLVVVVAGAIGVVVDANRRRGGEDRTRPLALAGLPLLLVSLEGVIGTPFDPNATASVTIVVDADAEEVAAALARPFAFEAELPAFLRFGFNRPVRAEGRGIAVGDLRTITFDGGTHDDHPLSVVGLVQGEHAAHLSQMHLRVAESAPGRVVFEVAHDGTMLSRWLDLDRATFTWRERPDGTTEVRLRFAYERLLYPTVYFAPLQGYGMDLAADHLLDAVVAGVDR